MAVKHNKNMEIDMEHLNYGLETILLHATDWNKLAYECVEMKNYKQGQIYAEVRDAYLQSYYQITGVRIDYADLNTE